jgi:hypothetical protein
MSNISDGARQRFRQKLQSLEFADEIVDGLNEFLQRFVLISNQFSSSEWNTVHTFSPIEDSAVMLTFSVRFLAEGSQVKMQVKGLSNNLTKWKGSIQIEQHSGE